MNMSDAGINFLKSIEGLRLRPYDDQTGERIYEWCKGATIGYGHLISLEEWPWLCNGVLQHVADLMFEDDLAPFEDLVSRHLLTPVQPHQFDALVIFAYNIGAPRFAASSVAKLLRDPRAHTPYPSLEEAWRAWNKSQGKINQGLINRRAAEWRLFTTGAYTRW